MSGATYSQGELSEHEKLADIFAPFVSVRRRAFLEKAGRFAHYTSAEAASQIIKTKHIWMRDATSMSDYREVQHGLEILESILSDERAYKEFTSAVDSCTSSISNSRMLPISESVLSIFNQLRTGLPNVFIVSVSEHVDGEDLHGRLSMWRAFIPICGSSHFAMLPKFQ